MSRVSQTKDEVKQPKLRILWLIELDYRAGMFHGGSLRFFNFSKELIKRGHQVYFAVRRKETDDAGQKREFLDCLKKQDAISDYYEIEYSYPQTRQKLGNMISHPGIANRLLRESQARTIKLVREIITGRHINLCIFNDRAQLFILPAIREDVKTVIDWVDSEVLFLIRETKIRWKNRQVAQIPKLLRYLLEAFIQENYYGKQCALNLVVSPVDKKYLDSINRRASKNRVLLNGVQIAGNRNGTSKVRNRIIFSGKMDFEPNYQSAIWFIDHVLPLLLKRNNDIRLVVAGADPVKELLARAGRHVEVTGYVDDMGREIARSEVYVAPLVSGGGFKNKVVEAITNGAFVVATGMAVEFLDQRLQKQFLVADTPQEMADCILSYLDDPQRFEPQLKALKKTFAGEFTWEKRTDELVQLAQEIIAGGVGVLG